MYSRSSQLTNSIAGIRRQIPAVPGHSVIQQITLTSPRVRKDPLIGDKTVLTTEARIFERTLGLKMYVSHTQQCRGVCHELTLKILKYPTVFNFSLKDASCSSSVSQPHFY